MQETQQSHSWTMWLAFVFNVWCLFVGALFTTTMGFAAHTTYSSWLGGYSAIEVRYNMTEYFTIIM